jgi:predicted nuclease of predicted toxin-antitoxin system
MRCLVDAQLPPALARWLQQRGHHAEHVEDAGLRHADDGDIWDRALRSGAVIITKDEDFVSRAAVTPNPPIILWLRLPNSSRRELLEWFEPRLPLIETRLEQGDRLIEVW